MHRSTTVLQSLVLLSFMSCAALPPGSEGVPHYRLTYVGPPTQEYAALDQWEKEEFIHRVMSGEGPGDYNNPYPYHPAFQRPDQRSYAHAINESGQVAGQGTTSVLSPGFAKSLASALSAPRILRAGVWEAGQYSWIYPTDWSAFRSSSADINDDGKVVGRYVLQDPNTNQVYYEAAYFWKGVLIEEIYDWDSFGVTEANAVNNADQVVGVVRFPTNLFPDGKPDAPGIKKAAFHWANGDLTYLSDASSTANDINDSGLIVGTRALSPIHPTRAVSWTATGMSELPDINQFLWSAATAVNAQGTIVGQAYGVLTGNTVCLWHGVSLTALPSYEDQFTVPLGINSSEVIVGYADDFGGAIRAVVGVEGVFYDLNDLVEEGGDGWTLVQATDINDAGAIVGFGQRSIGFAKQEIRAFMLEPLP